MSDYSKAREIREIGVREVNGYLAAGWLLQEVIHMTSLAELCYVVSWDDAGKPVEPDTERRSHGSEAGGSKAFSGTFDQLMSGLLPAHG